MPPATTAQPLAKKTLQLISERWNTNRMDNLAREPMNHDLPGLTFIDSSTLEVENRLRVDLSDRGAVETAYVVIANLQLGLGIDLGVLREQQVLAILHGIRLLCVFANRNGAVEHALPLPRKESFVQLAARRVRFPVIDMRDRKRVV